ncbi:MAG: hypothetical protein HY425_02275 [Candidatus Levybacteria bacterium]|nr:hypothetical protein [Candidatus Levybacteria bacterium]
MVVEARPGVITSSSSEQQVISGVNFRETIFVGKKEMLLKLSRKELAYLSFVVDARVAIVRGDESTAKLLMLAKKQELRNEWVPMVRALASHISIIHKAIPSPTIELKRIEETHGHVEVGESRENDETGELHDPIDDPL